MKIIWKVMGNTLCNWCTSRLRFSADVMVALSVSDMVCCVCRNNGGSSKEEE